MKKVIIVGGGIAGLTAGVYAQQSGLDATIFEMHSIPGGNSTSWKRKGYLFEGGMHWLVGSNPQTPMHRIWQETGALRENNPIYNRDPFLTYVGEANIISLYRDPEQLKQQLMRVSPQDSKEINSLISDIRILGKMSMPIMDIKGVKIKKKAAPPLSMLFAMIKALPRMQALDKISIGEYARRFRHPGIRTLLKNIAGSDDFSANAIPFTLGSLAVGDSGYPKGGSLRMAENIAEEFIALGGVIRYKTRAQQVRVEAGRVTGIIAGDIFHEADAVIVTADTLTAIDSLFETPLHEPWMDEMRTAIKPLNCTFIGLGVKADLRGLPENPLFPLAELFEYGGIQREHIAFNNYANYEGYASEGCTALTCALMGDTYDMWKAAHEDGSYAQKKQGLAESVIEKLARVIPETRGNVEVWDVATPLTYERYCGTWRGSWMSVTYPGKPRQQYPCKSERIGNLYFAGQRIMLPGGLPAVASSGRQAVQYLCRDEDLVFQGVMK